MKPIHNEIKNYILDSIYLKNKDIILAAHPKVGSTWIRFLMCNLLSLLEKNGELVDFNLLNEIMISFGDGKLKNKWEYSIPRIVKTHLKYYPIFRKKRIIFMLRDPRDVMISYYHFLKAQKKPKYHFKDAKKKVDYQENFTNFIQYPECGFKSFFKHYNSWKNKADIIIKYEDFKKRPFKELSILLKKLKLNIDHNTIKEAIRRSEIKYVRRMDNKERHSNLKKFKNGFKFTRDGSIEQWKKFYNKQQLKIFEYYKETYNFVLY